MLLPPKFPELRDLQPDHHINSISLNTSANLRYSTSRHGCLQAWARGALDPWKCYIVFCALVVTVKRSVNQLCMHRFHNFSSASGGGIPPRTPPRDFRLQTP